MEVVVLLLEEDIRQAQDYETECQVYPMPSLKRELSPSRQQGTKIHKSQGNCQLQCHINAAHQGMRQL